MRLLVRFITIFVRIYEKIAGLLFRIPPLLTGILPMLLPPKELTRLIRNHYDDSTGMSVPVSFQSPPSLAN
jgi:hypothetical protein